MASNPPVTETPGRTNDPEQPARHYTIHHDCGPRHHHDCGPRHHHHHGRHHHEHHHHECCGSCGCSPCVCVIKPFPKLELAPEFRDLGIRLAETMLAVPLVIATGVLAELSKHRRRDCGCQHEYHEHSECCHEGHRHCGCGCQPEYHEHGECCHEGRQHDEGCRHEKHKRRGTADIRIHASGGDVRNKTILVQNNGPHKVTVTLKADPWTDLGGRAIESAPAVQFTPGTLTLEPCEALETAAQISVTGSLSPGKTYLTQIHFEGSGARSILLELYVAPENQIEYCVETDPCRRSIGKYVDVCDEECHDHHDCCHDKKYDPCCHPPHGKDWDWKCDPWHWRGPDPYRFWYGLAHWQRLLLPHIAGERCC
jgi:hypothetical protein